MIRACDAVRYAALREFRPEKTPRDWIAGRPRLISSGAAKPYANIRRRS